MKFLDNSLCSPRQLSQITKKNNEESDEASAFCHFGASTIAAVINFPLWRAAAIQQSGFKLSGSNVMIRYYRAVTTPPFKGFIATIAGMAWARGAIFYCSEHGKSALSKFGIPAPFAQTLPPLVTGILVQIINMVTPYLAYIVSPP